MFIQKLRKGFLSVSAALFTSEEMRQDLPPPRKAMEFMDRGDSVCIIIQEEGVKGKFVLVRQFRIGPFIKESKRSSYSLAAGMVDEGETPEQAAEREIFEEVGEVAKSLDSLGTFYSSPGGTTERIHYFYATIQSGTVVSTNDPSEIHDIVKVSEKEFRSMIANGQIDSGQAALAFFLAEEKWFI